MGEMAKAPSRGARARDAVLDRAVKDALELKAEARAQLWALGAKLGEIKAAELWRLRRGDGKKPKWASFRAFCEGELGMSAWNAYALMRIAKCFTSQQCVLLGQSKLNTIARFPEKQWPILLGLARKGASTSELISAARAGGAASYNRVNRDLKDTRSAQKARWGKPRKEKIGKTVAADELTIALVATPVPGDTESRPATRIGQRPSGRWTLSDGRQILVELFEGPAGEICATLVEKARSEAA